MSIHRLLRMFTGDVCVLEPQTLRLGGQLLHRKLLGERFTGPQVHEALGVASPTQRREARETGIAVIPILGVIQHRMHSAGTSIEEVEMAFDASMASRRVDGVVFDIESPGGGVPGLPEFADKVFNARGIKPILSISNGLMASGALRVGSAAEEVWSIRSSESGSLGVFYLHIDESKSLEQDGVVVTEFSAGKFKTDGAPWAGPLSEETKEFLMARVDEAYGWFVKDMARFKGDTPANVRAGYGEGRVLSAEQALKANLVGKIGSFEQVVSRAANLGSKPKGRRAAALRAEMALDSADGII